MKIPIGMISTRKTTMKKETNAHLLEEDDLLSKFLFLTYSCVFKVKFLSLSIESKAFSTPTLSMHFIWSHRFLNGSKRSEFFICSRACCCPDGRFIPVCTSQMRLINPELRVPGCLPLKLSCSVHCLPYSFFLLSYLKNF